MKKVAIVLICCSLAVLLTAAAPAALAESAFFDDFKLNYALIDEDLLNSDVEVAEIEDFVYTRDVATFTFDEGDMYLARDILGRPTTAFFIGRGNLSIEVAPHVERQALDAVAEDSVVNEDFDVCLIRMGDDFDLAVRKVATFEKKTVRWREYNHLKQSQSEFYFQPVVYHYYDNYFQLLRSAYERSADGYFWADVNRYVFNYDPNRPEQVIVAYEDEFNDEVITEAAVFQKQSAGVVDDLAMSDLAYPTKMLSRTGTVMTGGMDGTVVDEADIELNIEVLRDSLRFMALYLHYYLEIDSILVDGARSDFHRRNDFSFVGLILPGYRYAGDTVSVRMFYHGKDYTHVCPFVENEAAPTNDIDFVVPAGYNYVIPGMGSPSEAADGHQRIGVHPTMPLRKFYFVSYASGFDTLTKVADVGLNVNLLKSSFMSKGRVECFIPDDRYETSALGAFNYLAGNYGTPPGTFEIYVYPEMDVSSPGLVTMRQDYCYQQGGGEFEVEAGYQMARQWFGTAMQPASYREHWLMTGLPQYLGVRYVEKALGGAAFFSELFSRRDLLLLEYEQKEDRPLAVGRRLSDRVMTLKSMFVLHMLRYVMYDLENHTDRAFDRMLYEFAQLANSRRFSNRDFIELAEKHYGASLDWFFRAWLFDAELPEYDVRYQIKEGENGFMISGRADIDKIGSDYTMPVIMRVEVEKGEDRFFREQLAAPRTEFQLGPFESRPKELFFNEFLSVLCKQDVKRED